MYLPSNIYNSNTFLATKATNAFGIYLHYGSELVTALTLHLFSLIGVSSKT